MSKHHLLKISVSYKKEALNGSCFNKIISQGTDFSFGLFVNVKYFKRFNSWIYLYALAKTRLLKHFVLWWSAYVLMLVNVKGIVYQSNNCPNARLN